MTTRTLQVMTDDFDGTELKPGQGQTVRFSFEGTDYSIDLSDKNVKKFSTEIGVWVAKAHTVKDTALAARRRSRAGRTGRSSVKTSAADMKALRDWAREHGYTVSERGRVPTEVRDAYTTAH